MTEERIEIDRINTEVTSQSTLLDQAINDLNAEVDEQSGLLDQATTDLNVEVDEQAGMLEQATSDLNTEVASHAALLDQAIAALQGKAAEGGGGAKPVITALEVTENGTYTAPDGVDGYSPVSVNVPIPAGLPEGVSKIASGVYQPTSDRTSAVDVGHGLGVKPDFCWWVLESDVSTAPMTSTTVLGCYSEKAAIYSTSLNTPYHSHYFMVAYNSSGALQRTAQSVEAAAFTTTTCRLMANAQYRLKAGCTYRWVCGVLG